MKQHEDGAEIVGEAGAEGGSLTLFRRAMPRGGYAYFTDLNAMGFEDIAGVQHQSGAVATLEEGFALLDASRGCEWHRLHPMAVHPDHAADVLRAVESRLLRDGTRASNAQTLDGWRHACGMSSGE